MLISNLKNLRYSNLLSQISVSMSRNFCTVSFATCRPLFDSIPSFVTVSNRDHTFKKFRSLTSLHKFLQEVYSWPIHPDLEHKDQLEKKPVIMVL